MKALISALRIELSTREDKAFIYAGENWLIVGLMVGG